MQTSGLEDLQIWLDKETATSTSSSLMDPSSSTTDFLTVLALAVHPFPFLAAQAYQIPPAYCYPGCISAELAVLAVVDIVHTHHMYRLHKDDFQEGPGKLLDGTIYRIFDILLICIIESQYQS